MAGLLNSPQAGPLAQPTSAPQAVQPVSAPQVQQPAQSKQSSLADPILQKIEAAIEAKVSSQIRRNYLSCVNAGMAVMFGPQNGQKVLAKMKSSQDILSDITAGTANVFATIVNEIVGKMPQQQRQQFMQTLMPALLAASATVTCHALDTAEKLGKIAITPQLAAQSIHDAALACLQKLGIGKSQIQAATARVQQGQAQAAPGQPAAAAQPGAQ